MGSWRLGRTTNWKEGCIVVPKLRLGDTMSINLSKYTKHGNFRLHSGQYSGILYDVKEMICCGELDEILFYADSIKLSLSVKTFVGIESAGAIIATYLAYMNGHNSMAIVTKKEELVGIVREPYVLIDDVCTSGNSLLNAINTVGIIPYKIFVIIDRRIEKFDIHGIKIDSIFSV